MGHVSLPDLLALVAELVEEEEPAKAVLLDEAGEAAEGEGSDDGQRELHHRVVGALVAGVAGGAGEDEVGEEGDSEGEEEEEGPGEEGVPGSRLVHTHPSQPRPEAPKLICRIRFRPI